jgi:PTH1 family peptidyl-tRNA hydrolase
MGIWNFCRRKRPDRLVIGLGNPGVRYKATRHNIGWMALDRMAGGKSYKKLWGCRSYGCYLEIADPDGIEEKPILLVKPWTFMNNSGLAVDSLCRRFGLDPERILILLDDVDLELGRVRLREAGGSAGHRGMSSVMDHLETDRVPRLRLGVGRPARGQTMVEHVLSPFEPGDEAEVEDMLRRAEDAVGAWCWMEMGRAMNMVNAAAPASSAMERQSI